MGRQKRDVAADTRALDTALQLTGGSRGRHAAKKSVDNNQLFDAALTVDKGAARGALAQANELLDTASKAVAKIILAARRNEQIELAPLKSLVNQFIESSSRSTNAMLWALAVNTRMHYLHRRAVGSAVLAMTLGRFMGCERAALQDLGLGGLLLDIGKVGVPITILAKTGGLSDAEQSFTRRHVDESVRILEAIEGLSPTVVDMVRSHHERLDGSGYPAGLQGDQIPLSAQIAGIVDSFDALCLSRYYANGVSTHDALSSLNDERGKKFDADLVDKFICAVGVFATDSWVELDNGSMGVVYLQNRHDPMCPHIALIADSKKRPFLSARWLTLSDKSVVRAMEPAERPPYAVMMETSLQSSVYGTLPRKRSFRKR